MPASSDRYRHRLLPLVHVVTLAALSLCQGKTAHAQSLYVTNDLGQFGTLNVTSGAYTRLGSTTYNGTQIILGGLANAANGNLYGMESNVNQDTTTATTLRLFQVNRASGVLSLVGAVSAFTNNTHEGYATLGNTSDGTLYAIYTPRLFATNSTLYTLNASSAVATAIGNTGAMFDGGLNGDGSGGLYATAGEFSLKDYRLNRASGAATTLQTSAGATYSYALGFTAGSLYSLDRDGGIYTVNTTTGVMTNTNITYSTRAAGALYGAAATTQIVIPEPGALPLVGIGLLASGALFGRLKRQRAEASSPATTS